MGRFAIAVAVILLAVPIMAYGDVVTDDEAQAIAANFVDHMIDVYGNWGGSKEAEIVSCDEVCHHDLLLGYHLSVSPSGYVFVPATRWLAPVKSFSFTEDFDPQAETGYWQLLKDAVETAFRAIEERYGEPALLASGLAPKQVNDQWQWLLEGAKAPASIDTVGPLLKTRWDQGVPFNDSCPMGDGGRCLVGCVATAAAQIMRYWRHPSYGVGSKSYYWDGDQSCGGNVGGGTLTANFEHPYDWWHMKKWYITYDSTQAAAVAQFCRDVGHAWRMDYGHCGSGAYTADGLFTYSQYFKYLNKVRRKNRSDYGSAEDWFQVLKAQLDATPPRVMHYHIYSHSIACDGYIDDVINYIHMNYGWGGSYNNWYAVDELYCPWSGCDPMQEYALVGIQPGADFIDVTSGGLGSTANTYGVAWGDYDADGDPDLYITNAGSANRLFRNDGGTFTDVTAGPLGDTGNGRGAAWADFDNDGDLDLYVCNSGGANKLLRNDGGSFTDVTGGPLGDTGNTEAGVWGDYDNDGFVDLYIVNNGANKLLKNNGDGTFTDVTSGPLGDSGNGYASAWCDYDLDGDLDLYLVNNGANKLLRNDGGVFTDVTSGPLGDTASGRAVAWGDYDNDGDFDLYLVNDGSANKLLRNDAGSFTDVTPSPLGDAGSGYGVAWADYEKDGDLDLYLARSGEANIIFRNNGDSTFTNITVTPLGETGAGRGIAWADYDGDGKLDIYLANSGTSNFLFHNEYQPATHWLGVRLVGILSNKAAIGALVRVVTSDGTQIRQISGGSGYCSQSSLVAHFGVGDYTIVDTVEVRWPSGVVYDTTLVDADQVIEITEEGISGLADTDLPQAHLYPAQPNPFKTSVLVRFALPSPMRVSLRVYDVRGQLVEALVDGQVYSPGDHRLSWSGLNREGQQVASGIYFMRLEAGGSTSTRRVVYLK